MAPSLRRSLDATRASPDSILVKGKSRTRPQDRLSGLRFDSFSARQSRSESLIPRILSFQAVNYFRSVGNSSVFSTARRPCDRWR